METRCTERGCPFPASGQDGLCTHHRRLFALDASPSELSDSATEEDLTSAIFYDQSITIAKRGIVPVDEFLEDMRWAKTRKKVSMDLLRRRRREARLCIYCGKPTLRQKGTACDSCLNKKKERRGRVALQGLCVDCGARKPRTGKSTCLDCASAHLVAGRRSYKKMASLRPKREPAPKTAGGTYLSELARRKRLRLQGKCANCGRASNGKTYCKECYSKKLLRQSDRYQSLRARAVCIWCRIKPASAGRSHCAECAERNKTKALRRHRKLKRMRLCTGCGRERPRRARKMCSNCARKLSNQWQQRQQRRKSFPA